ncbi:MAG TPA: glycosyltransferase [Firmicutes bacterium]|nr:glycosyltransferase [Bacillota bacterium]HBT15609.1 glycosyltransferase [Bacillota bacterium]
MKILMQNRSSVLKMLAGDSVQMNKTREALIQLGVEVDVKTQPVADFSSYDLVHLFNIIPIEETYQYYHKAKKYGVPIVLSPIYWDPKEFLINIDSERKDHFLSWWAKTNELRQEVLDGVDLLLPNGIVEHQLLVEKYKLVTPYQIIPNGVDPVFYYANPDKFIKRFGIKDFLLCVGRICRRKNQKDLIKAARTLNQKVVLIGPINDYQYYQECRQEGEGSVRFLGALNQSWISSAYAACGLHALSSWYETPGLVNLEAGLAGCKLVTTNRGTTSEYLKEMAWYCSPEPHSIKDALRNALYSPPHSGLREHILANFTWDRVARLTLQAYQEILG